MDSTSSSPPHAKQTLKQACDNCRRRKIKCNRAQPCDKCQRLLLSCSYCDVLQRKGPKFRTLYPLAPLQYPTTDQANPSESIVAVDGGWAAPIVPWNNISNGQSYESYSSPDSMDSQYELPNPSSCHMSLRAQQQPGRLSSTALLAHVNIYLKYLYPIMPVLNPEHALNDSQDPERLGAERYAFLTALCAATHVQLQLDEVIDSAFSSSSLSYSGIGLLTEATNARGKCNNVCEHVSVQSLLTSFFLFAACGNLDQHDQAWFYLSQATSMAHTLGLHRESTYAEFGPAEAEERRRVFWLLFVTERAYALQQSKPIMLRNSIRKPQILPIDDPIMQYAFHNLIDIFQRLTAELYDWIVIECDENFVSSAMPQRNTTLKLRDIHQRSLLHHQNVSIRRPAIPIESVMEIQTLDAAATQQWLRVMLWKLSMSDLSQPTSTDALLPFHLPVLVGQQEQKQRLFAEISDLKVQEFLLDILNILSRIRLGGIGCSMSLEQAQQICVSSPSPPLLSSSNQFL
ncbi:hypothetical protein UA08_05953 [Talaromyces atroroseus]|uniref:Zn(2)-C6 fungal-type domain-containing protein n=1 Tax=Talaromyces atroroseus TaxID=1441469 RepID=A0A225B017_TALAT|nr:hypothetical protein UA08_05953 [Talaromyces atroroseus]OKL59127.1 hypothetical protein UA08_05953 [Talaromyces atroroseus]